MGEKDCIACQGASPCVKDMCVYWWGDNERGCCSLGPDFQGCSGLPHDSKGFYKGGQMGDYKIYVGDMTLNVKKLPHLKKPILTVSFFQETHEYKIASFDSETLAQWFVELMSDREYIFKGKKEEQA